MHLIIWPVTTVSDQEQKRGMNNKNLPKGSLASWLGAPRWVTGSRVPRISCVTKKKGSDVAHDGKGPTAKFKQAVICLECAGTRWWRENATSTELRDLKCCTRSRLPRLGLSARDWKYDWQDAVATAHVLCQNSPCYNWIQEMTLPGFRWVGSGPAVSGGQCPGAPGVIG